MGDYRHQTIIITDDDVSDIHQEMLYFKASLPAHLQSCLVGPFNPPANGFVQYLFLPSGGKVGGSIDGEHAHYRIELLKKMGHRAVLVTHGECDAHAMYGPDGLRARWGVSEPDVIFKVQDKP